MNNFFKLMFTYIGIWLVAAALNGLLSGICIMLFDDKAKWPFFTYVFCSFIFSAPVIFIAWIITLSAYLNGSRADKLYSVVLHSGFYLAIAAGIAAMFIFNNMLKHSALPVFLCIIVSAVASILSFRNTIKKII